MAKLNCWEFTRCGREENGEKVGALGACPASTDKRAHGANGGKNGGRACWAIAGTYCSGDVLGTVAKDIETCLHCCFFRQVELEERKCWREPRQCGQLPAGRPTAADGLRLVSRP